MYNNSYYYNIWGNHLLFVCFTNSNIYFFFHEIIIYSPIFYECIKRYLHYFQTQVKWKRKKKKKNDNSTRCSQAVSHPSTNRAQCCLTSVIGRELVCSTWYGRCQEVKEKLRVIVFIVVYLYIFLHELIIIV